MPVVIDANLIVILASNDPRAGSVSHQFREWLDSGVDLHAPTLLRYEVANALTRLVAFDRLPKEELTRAWDRIDQIPLHFHAMAFGEKVVSIALRRQSAYDAAYLALASELDAELWTLDGPLYRNAAQIGFPVQLIE